MSFTGKSQKKDSETIEILELKSNKFFIGT